MERYPVLAALKRIKERHGLRGLIALLAFVGTSISGYALAYGLLVSLG